MLTSRTSEIKTIIIMKNNFIVDLFLSLLVWAKKVRELRSYNRKKVLSPLISQPMKLFHYKL